MSIDYGRKRSGLAVTDELQIIATGLGTVASHELIRFLKDYFAKEKVDLLVIGEPKQLNNKPSESLQYIRPFVAKLKQEFPDIAVEMLDERFTSKMAFQTMIDGGLKRKDRQNKALVDTVSATILLQSFLEMKAHQKYRQDS